MPLSARLQELMARLHEVEAERDRLLAAIAQEEAREKEAFVRDVLARWEADMTATDIATTLRCTPEQVRRIVDAERKRQGVTVRRGRSIPERRTLRQPMT